LDTVAFKAKKINYEGDKNKMRIKIFNSYNKCDLETEINDWLSKNKSSIIIKDIQIKPYATAHSGYILGYALYDIKIEEDSKENIDKNAEDYFTSKYVF
jgi:hypothetical protein